MRVSILICSCTLATIGCGNDSQSAGPDTPTGNHPPPRVIGALATNDDGTNSATASNSIVLQRGLPGAPFAASAWLAPPGTVSLTRTSGSWTAIAGALVTGAIYDMDATHHLLSVTAFDGSTSFTLPDVLAPPTQGALIGHGTALEGTLDVTNFSIDSDFAKITGVSSLAVTVH